MLMINTAMKQRESGFKRFFLAYYLLALHLLLLVGMVMFMATFVNKRLVNSATAGGVRSCCIFEPEISQH